MTRVSLVLCGVLDICKDLSVDRSPVGALPLLLLKKKSIDRSIAILLQTDRTWSFFISLSHIDTVFFVFVFCFSMFLSSDLPGDAESEAGRYTVPGMSPLCDLDWSSVT